MVDRQLIITVFDLARRAFSCRIISPPPHNVTSRSRSPHVFSRSASSVPRR